MQREDTFCFWFDENFFQEKLREICKIFFSKNKIFHFLEDILYEKKIIFSKQF